MRQWTSTPHCTDGCSSPIQDPCHLHTCHGTVTLHHAAAARAQVQDAAPRLVWAQNLSTEDLRNTLVVELAQVLGNPVESIQAITDVELVQQVDGL